MNITDPKLRKFLGDLGVDISDHPVRPRRADDPNWRDPLIGLAEEVIDWYATAFHVGGYFMVSTFENYLRSHIALNNLMTGVRP
jgi:hypothetical protein